MGANIFIADDDPAVVASLCAVLKRQGHLVESAHNGHLALHHLERAPVDLVMLDLHLPDRSGLSVLQSLRESGMDAPVIMISGDGTIEAAVEAMRLGALDFVRKPLETERVSIVVKNALRFSRMSRRQAELEAEFELSRELIGESQPMQELRSIVAKAAPSEGRVLITGENGTGKELVAQAIHALSARAEQSFVKVNCAAIPRELFESELFGHEKGAFTGADRAKRGRFELAHRGTLFLDEIGEMTPSMQAKLLRVLQEGELERVGGTTSVKVDARVIAATNRDVEAMCLDGSFREDLYYRLNVIRIHTPTLSERHEDIPALIDRFTAVSCKRNNRRRMSVSDEAMKKLAQHSYPGNVRELQNIVERLVILSDSDVIDERLVADIGRSETRQASAGHYRVGAKYRELMEELQRSLLVEALAAHDHNMSKTARSLGLARSALYKKCETLGIDHNRG